MKTLQLVLREILRHDVAGAIAEAGVFRGEFAQYLNAAFPDRPLYLCDTFEGFRPEEEKREVAAGNATEAFTVAYKETVAAAVLRRMKHPEQIILKQGFFPQTMAGVEETFAFVSLDMDFEQSIYDGLAYFYPRLAHGGYIFIHDYNSPLRGVEKAVNRYEREHGNLARVPMADANGSLVVMKP